MGKVISLGAARIKKEALAVTAQKLAPVALDYSDIARFSDESGPANTDPVQFGPKATMQLRRMFWGYGLRQMPATWAELVANHSYCQLLKLWSTRFNPGGHPEMEEAAFERHEKESPGRGVLLKALVAGDLDAVYAHHVANETFTKNTTVPILLREKGR
jgi:hypothetical protein